MLASALPVARQVAIRPIGPRVGVQCLAGRRLRTPQYRLYANTKPSINDPEAPVLPGSRSRTAASPQPAPPGPIGDTAPKVPTPPTPTTEKIVPPQNMPLMPPPPPTGKMQTAPPTSIPPAGSAGPIPRSQTSRPTPVGSSPPPPPPPPPQPKRRSGRFRRALLYLILLGGIGYAGGVYYSLLSDNFHDFFTEYVPFGEQAVLYFEEREYRKRFPSLTNPSNRPALDSGNRITIPSKSGVSWKVAGQEHQGSDTTAKGAHMSATDASKAKSETAQQNPTIATGAEKKEAVEKAKKESKSATPTQKKSEQEKKAVAPIEAPKPKAEAVAAPKAEPTAAKSSKEQSLRPPEVNEPSRIMPIEPIDPLKIKNATEPLVQDLVKILNDIITVVNSDNASQKYSSTITKAKTALQSVGSRILSLKSSEQQAAEAKIKATQLEFDTAAKELVRRLEAELHTQETQFRTDFETERAALAETYQTRLSQALSTSQDLTDTKLQNELLQQSLRLKSSFQSSLATLLDNERNARLANLSSLASAVADLSDLVSSSSHLFSTLQQTQSLSIAVSALRAHLDAADRPVPFTHYLAALKQLSPTDPVITAAIASLNPTAYQQGIPTSAQLLDRFRRVAAEVRKAALLPANAGVASHAASYVLSGVMFQKHGMPAETDAGAVGGDVEAVLARAGTLMEEGRLDEAAREMNALEGWAGVLSYDWLAEVRRVLEVRMAVEVMGAEVRLEGLRAEGVV